MKNFKNTFTRQLKRVIKENDEDLLSNIPTGGEDYSDPGTDAMSDGFDDIDGADIPEAGDSIGGGGAPYSSAISKAKNIANECQSFITRLMEMIEALSGDDFDQLIDVKFSPAMTGLQAIVTELTASIHETARALEQEKREKSEDAVNPPSQDPTVSREKY